jgi:hypothetical protein
MSVIENLDTILTEMDGVRGITKRSREALAWYREIKGADPPGLNITPEMQSLPAQRDALRNTLLDIDKKVSDAIQADLNP